LGDPYLLNVGDSVEVIISATNAYGTSAFSAPGTGGLIQVVPDPPRNLADDGSSASQLRITWEEGATNGGAVVIDYWVYFDQANNDWIEVAGSLVYIYNYVSTFPLVQGTTYGFKVRSRNSVGYSDYSDVLYVLAS
jgi:hypothetical protein